jgi:hypothetical protein
MNRAKQSPQRGLSRLLTILLVLVLVVGAGVALALAGMNRSDREHARFYAAGASVKGFLGDYCATVKQAFDSGDPGLLATMYSESYAGPGRGAWALQLPQREGGVDIHELRAVGVDDFDLQRRLAEAADYLAGLSRIDETECKIHLIEDVTVDGSVRLTVRYVLAGSDAAGRAMEDRYLQRWLVEPSDDPDASVGWRIATDELVGGTRTVAGDETVFRPLDLAAAGIDFRHRRDPKLDRKKHSARLAFDVFQHASGGVSAADFDQDGWSDLLFVDGVDSRLYRHEGLDKAGRPRFTDVTAKAGLEGLDQAQSALFADFDNDGDRDLFVARYLAPSRLYVNRGDGVFDERAAEMGIDFVAASTSTTLLDFDHDGFLDIYVGAYGNVFEAIPRLPFFATNGDTNRLYRNLAGQGFEDVTSASGAGDTGWSLAVAAGDYDGDGWTDLGVANDMGRKSLYRNNGDGTFSELAREAGVLDFSGGMGLAFGDLDNDGLNDLYTSNIYSNQRWFGEDQTIRQYMRNVLRTRWAIADFGEYWKLQRLLGSDWRRLGYQIGEGNSVFRNAGDGTFDEIVDTPASFAGWSWGVVLEDYDNDTDLDLYAANGWISATPATDL